ncbi:MAG: tetratricopeptide repeat protein [Gemmatimonadota bacterium]|nr:tetratricopeptide repeat protein [Gemmatimonadota bacterium]
MSVSAGLDRALLLHQRGKDELAEIEVRGHLVDYPEDAFAHALLGLILLARERFEDAEESARVAVGHDPELSFAFYALAVVLLERRRPDAAEESIREAIRLDPEDADFHGLLATIEFRRRRWEAALAAAETGLRFDAEHVACNNLRAMALVKLGREPEAGATMDRALARDPDNSMSHANMGWTLLHQGRHDEAMTHFRESLRVDATNDWARAGLVEGLKAGNPLYALMLRYFLWMGKLSGEAGWAVIIGGWVGYRLLRNVARARPELAPWIMPILVIYVVFALLTWLAGPFFNLTLFLHPLGRHALTDDQRAQATMVGGTLTLALVSAGLELAWPGEASFVFLALAFGLLSLPLSAVHVCEPGWPRRAMTTIAATLAVFGVTGSVVMGMVRPPEDSGLETLGLAAFVLFVVGTLISQWVANWLMHQEPER